MASAEPKIFGAVPPVLALALGIAGIGIGLVLTLTGTRLFGVGLVVCGAGLILLAMDAARRWPSSAVPRATVRAADAVGGRMGLGRVWARAWSAAGREVIRLRGELRDLRSVREAHLVELGLAAYRDDAERMEALRAELTGVDEAIEERESRMSAALGRARERVRRKRAAVQPTQSFAVPEAEPPLEEDAPTRTTPTVERPSR